VKVFGIVGWKNTGKTGLMERLITEITARGFTVSTVKHAHHSFDVDQEGRDSYRHRIAGAEEVLLTSDNRWALMHELRGEPELRLDTLLQKLTPVDLVLVEGFKWHDHAKLECHRGAMSKGLVAEKDTSIVAIASDAALETDKPVFDLDDTLSITDFVLDHVGLGK